MGVVYFVCHLLALCSCPDIICKASIAKEAEKTIPLDWDHLLQNIKYFRYRPTNRCREAIAVEQQNTDQNMHFAYLVQN